MKQALLGSLLALAFVITGCSDKAPKVVASAPAPAPAPVAQPAPEPAPAIPEVSLDSINADLGKVYFDYDKFNIRNDMTGIVSGNAGILNSNAYGIRVEGNCDEWGSDEYNYALGLKRATAVKNALVNQGVDANRINTVSYGESNLACTERSESCDAANRRVETYVQ